MSELIIFVLFIAAAVVGLTAVSFFLWCCYRAQGGKRSYIAWGMRL